MSKVAVIKCEDYDIENVYNAVKRGIDLIGGIEKFINKEEKILLKPNLLAGNSPEKAVTTHPAVFEAIIKILREEEYRLVEYGDSPGIGSPSNVSEKCGLKVVAEKYGVPLADFNASQIVSNKNAKRCMQFEMANGALECEAIINIPKMKAHQLQRITGAVKNTMGCIQGFKKGMMHAKFTNAYTFAEMLIDLNQILPVRLHIMDGILAMEGNGPRSGNPIKMNVILVSDDPVALDSVFCKLIDIDHELIPTITYGKEYNLGTYDDIEIIGDSIDELINKEFDIQRVELKKEDNKMLPLLRKWLVRKPLLKKGKCIKCGICEESCPIEGKAVILSDSKKGLPKFNYKKCVRCYCCQEMCPKKAIDVKTPVLGKMFVYRK